MTDPTEAAANLTAIAVMLLLLTIVLDKLSILISWFCT